MYPERQAHTKVFRSSTHVPPFRHGLVRHSFIPEIQTLKHIKIINSPFKSMYIAIVEGTCLPVLHNSNANNVDDM